MKQISFIVSIMMCMILISCLNSGSEESNHSSNYREALAANDFEGAHKILAQAEADHEAMSSEDFEEKYGIAHYGGIESAKNEIFDKEVKFLVADGSSEANARLVFLLSDFEIKGKKLPKGINDYYDGSHNSYSNSISTFNSKLDMVLDLAISQDNKELAKKIIKLYKENMDIFMGGSSHSKDEKNGHRRYFDIAPDGTEVDGDHCYVTYNWDDKEAAQKKYKENFGSLSEAGESSE